MVVKKIIKYVLGIIAIWQLTACCKVACVGNYIVLDYSNYKVKDFDTLYFLGYERGSNFSILKDSSIRGVPFQPNDTTTSSYSTSFNIDYDWIVKMPRQNKTFRFTNYNTSTDRCSCGNTKYEVLLSYTVNGATQTNYVYQLPK